MVWGHFPMGTEGQPWPPGGIAGVVHCGQLGCPARGLCGAGTGPGLSNARK